MSYSLSSNFVPVKWYLDELWPLNLYFCSNFKLSGLDIWYVAISRWVTVYVRISFRSNDFWLSYSPWTCIFCSNFKLSGLFFNVLWDIDLIFGMWYKPVVVLWFVRSQFYFSSMKKYIFCVSIRTIILKVLHIAIHCPLPATKIRGPTWLSGLFFNVLWDIDLIFGMWLYLDELQFKFEFRSVGWFLPEFWPLNL
jgi:hypothetical protein